MTDPAKPPHHPSHPTLISVQAGPPTKPFSTRAVTLQDRPAGALFAPITGWTPTGARTYATVQRSTDADLELNSDLVYCNHSCTPSLVFDMARLEVRVVEGRDLKVGDELTFFYPSTEWDMQQPFACDCGGGEGVCVGEVKGAKYLDEATLGRYWLNAHIEELLGRRKGSNGVNGSA